MKLTVKQTQALDILEDNETSEFAFGGGAGGGKSLVGCYWVVKCCLRYPETRWLIGRTVLKRLKQTTYLTLLEVLKMQGLKQYVHWSIDNSNYTLKFFNGSTIMLKDLSKMPSDPNYDYLGSLEITGAFVDESTQIEAKCKEVLKSRIRFKLDDYGLIPKLLLTCNPSRGYMYNQFYMADKNGTIKSYRRFLQALATDNKHLSKEYIKSLKQLDENTKQRLLYGNWEFEESESQLFPYEIITGLFSKTDKEAQKSKQRYISADIALQGSDKFVVVVWEGYKVINLFTMDKSEPDEVVQLIKDISNKYNVPKKNIVYDGDGVGAYLSSYLKGAYSFKNNGRPYHKENYSNLKSQCFWKFSEKVNEGVIDFSNISTNHSDKIQEELTVIRNDSFGTDKKLAVTPKQSIISILGHSPDYADALAMRFVFDAKSSKTKLAPVIW